VERGCLLERGKERKKGHAAGERGMDDGRTTRLSTLDKNEEERDNPRKEHHLPHILKRNAKVQ